MSNPQVLKPRAALITRTHLTKREWEVCELIADGNTTRQIALFLGLAVKTVDAHRFRAMKVLHAHRIADICKYVYGIRYDSGTFSNNQRTPLEDMPYRHNIAS